MVTLARTNNDNGPPVDVSALTERAAAIPAIAGPFLAAPPRNNNHFRQQCQEPGTWRQRAMKNFGQKMTGVTLIEVMISLVILAVGLLGIAAMHGLGTKFGNKAYFRTQAIAQAYDIVDRMRANPVGVTAGDYIQDPIPSTSSSDCGSSVCTAADLATYDLVAWNTLNGAVLPNGTGSVSIADSDITVVVNWVEDNNGDGVAETISVSITAQI